MVFGRPFVKRFALWTTFFTSTGSTMETNKHKTKCYRSVVLSVLSVCLSVTLVYCGQTVGRIKMKLGMQVGLGPGHTVLGGDPGPPPPIFGPYLWRPNDCMDQDVTWYGGRSQPRRICVRWGPSPLPPKGGGAPLPNFQPISIVAKRLHASKCHFVWS